MQPSNPQPNDADDRAGRQAETKNFLRYLEESLRRRSIIAYAMPDAVVVLPDRTIAMAEYKFQSKFTAPPYDGNGLPVSQAKRYVELKELSGVSTSLIIEDRIDGSIYTAWLHKLEAQEHFDTVGKRKTPRRIYRLNSFGLRDTKPRRDEAA